MTLQEFKQVLKFNVFTDKLAYSPTSDTFYIYDENGSDVVASFQADNWNSLLNQYRTYLGTVEHNDSNLPIIQFITFGDLSTVETPLTISRQLKMLNGPIGLCPLNDETAYYTYNDWLKSIIERKGKIYEVVTDVKAGETYTVSIEGGTASGDLDLGGIVNILVDYENKVFGLYPSLNLDKRGSVDWKVTIDDSILNPTEDAKMHLNVFITVLADGEEIANQIFGKLTIKDSSGNVVSTEESKEEKVLHKFSYVVNISANPAVLKVYAKNDAIEKCSLDADKYVDTDLNKVVYTATYANGATATIDYWSYDENEELVVYQNMNCTLGERIQSW